MTDALGRPRLDVRLPVPPADPVAVDLSKYVGRYERRTVHTTVAVEGDGLVARIEYVDIDFDLPTPPPMPIVAVDTSTFVALGPDGGPAMPMQFLEFDGEGRPQLLFAARLSRRAA